MIGPAGIGQAHTRELIKYGVKNIGLLGKKFKKNRIADFKFKISNDVSIYNFRNHNELKKFNPKIICICSPTTKHLEHILKFKNYSDKIIVEKPLFWIKNKKIKNFNIAKKILNNSNYKVLINLPMINLAEQLIKKKEIKKIDYIKFNYFTRGNNAFEEIAIDLLPHALSFVLSLKKRFRSVKILMTKKKKNYFENKILIDHCLCHFVFKQNRFWKKSKLSFKINNNSYVRKQISSKGEYYNKLVKNKKKIINIKNPMSEYLFFLFKNCYNKPRIKHNNNITLDTIGITEDIINFKN